MADDGEYHDFYKYTPSKAAAAVFIVLFLLTSGFHILQMIKTRVWFFIPVVVGGICKLIDIPELLDQRTVLTLVLASVEIVGYGARIVSSTQAPLFDDTPFIIQSLFLLLAPALFAASVYMELGRIIAVLHGDKYSIVRRKWMTKVFVTGDVLSFVVQGAGKLLHQK